MWRWTVFVLFIIAALVALFLVHGYQHRVICNQMGGIYFSGECYEAREINSPENKKTK